MAIGKAKTRLPCVALYHVNHQRDAVRDLALRLRPTHLGADPSRRHKQQSAPVLPIARSERRHQHVSAALLELYSSQNLMQLPMLPISDDITAITPFSTVFFVVVSNSPINRYRDVALMSLNMAFESDRRNRFARAVDHAPG